MERKIIVPVTLQKDARLADLDVDFELEVNCSLSHQILAPEPPPPTRPVAEAKKAPEAAPLPAEPSAPPAKPRRPTEEKTTTITVPPFLREHRKPVGENKTRTTASKTKIDNVLDELLKKRAPKK